MVGKRHMLLRANMIHAVFNDKTRLVNTLGHFQSSLAKRIVGCSMISGGRKYSTWTVCYHEI
jgi:hypothetical protein